MAGKGRKAARRLGGLLAGLALALGAAELVAGRMIRDGKWRNLEVPPFGVISAERLQREVLPAVRQLEREPVRHVLNDFHPVYGWTNRPGVQVHEGIEVHIGPGGARGEREYAVPKPAGVARVACYGDSFTFGAEVEDGEAWPARLEALEPGWEVVNLGVTGWGTDQALLRFRDTAPELGPDVALMGLMLENIGRNVNRYRALWSVRGDEIACKPRFRLAGGELELVPVPYASRLEVLRAALDGTLRDTMRRGDHWDGDDPWPPFSSLARILAAPRANRRRDHIRLWRDPGGEPFRVTVALLDAFAREARALGARPGVVVFPADRDLRRLRARGGAPDWAPLLAWLDGRGIPYRDVSGALLADVGKRSPRALFVTTHYNARGNELVAEDLRGFVAELLAADPDGGVAPHDGAR